MQVWYCDHFEVELPEKHRFPMQKYRALRLELTSSGVLRRDELTASEPLSRETLEVCHTQRYLDACFAGRLDEDAIRRVGFPWTESLLTRSLASAAGTLAAARNAVRTGFGANLAGGTHHAHADFGSGYCVFNDLAVAAKTLLQEGTVRHVLIVDLDVHQGDGTAAICASDDRITTFSMHGEKNFPFRKQRSTCDVELADGTTDGVYLAALEDNLTTLFESADPDVVLYQAGVDVLREDTLGRLSLTLDGIAQRDAMLFSACQRRGVPVAMTLGGGYASPLQKTVNAHLVTYRQARRFF
jgi:acetoin utilization deacetylase AcuC-like enzyme